MRPHRIDLEQLVFNGYHSAAAEVRRREKAGRARKDSDMSTATIGRKILLITPMLASAALALPLMSQAASGTPKPGPPLVTSGAVAHVRGTSAELLGAINPRGAATTYYFEYGPTITYGRRTSSATLPAGFRRVKVGRPVLGLLPGYHYRLAATNAFIPLGAKFGKDRTYTPKTPNASRLAFVIPKPTAATVFGKPLIVSGTLSGVGGANRAIVLQESPYPFLEAFTSVGSQVTSSAGRFSFRVGTLSLSTQFRLNTVDPRPLYSKIFTEQVAVRVTFKVRSAGRPGYVRLYGTVAPAHVGARVEFQVQKHVRPGRSEKTAERTVAWVAQGSTVVKRATKTVSRFSSIVSIRHSGRYRAFVVIHRGAFVSGFSEQTIVLHAAPARKKQAKKH